MRLRVILGRIAAIISALVLIGAAGGLVYLDPHPAPPALRAHQGAIELPPADAVVVCTGGLTSQSEASGDEEFGNKPTATHTLTSAVALTSAGAQVEGSYQRAGTSETFPWPKAGADASIYRAENETVPGIVSAHPTSQQAPAQVAASVSINEAGDLRGLSAATCTAPSADAWLVGGKTTLGASAQLQVTNPSRTPARIAIEVLSERGPLTATAITRTIGAGQSEAIALTGLASDVERLAVHITASGGKVSAALQHHELDGIIARGSGLVAQNAPAAREQYVPGVWLGDDINAGAVRLVNPNEAPLTASVSVIGAEGEVALDGASDITIDAQAVQDISLAGLPAGHYTVKVTASEPLLAAASTERSGSDQASALTWSPGQVAGADLLLPIIDDHDLKVAVQLTNPGATPVRVEIVDIDSAGAIGQVRSIAVAGLTSIDVPVSAGTKALQLHGDSEVLAAAQLTYQADDGALSATLGASSIIGGVRSVNIELDGFAR